MVIEQEQLMRQLGAVLAVTRADVLTGPDHDFGQ